MVFYSFYTDKSKSPEHLVYRTENGWSQLQVNLKFFPQKEGSDGAQKDFFEILYDNPDFRQGEYFDTEKGKKKSVQAQSIEKEYNKIPEGFSIELDKVYNLDCILFMKELPDKYIDYIFTSPPYNAGKRTSFGERNSIYKDNEDMYNEYEDEMNNEEYEKWIFDIISESLRVTKKHIFFNIQMLGNNKKTVLKIFSKFENYIKDIFIWNKTIASPHINKKIPNSAFEFIIVFSNDHPEKRSFDDSKFDGKFRNVITGLNSSQNKYKDLNKATFPLYLPRTFMINFGKPGDIWYDPFSGTGTTFQASIIENKHFLGTEIDKEQCDVTNKRIFIEESALKFDFGSLLPVPEYPSRRIEDELPKELEAYEEPFDKIATVNPQPKDNQSKLEL